MPVLHQKISLKNLVVQTNQLETYLQQKNKAQSLLVTPVTYTTRARHTRTHRNVATRKKTHTRHVTGFHCFFLCVVHFFYHETSPFCVRTGTRIQTRILFVFMEVVVYIFHVLLIIKYAQHC